MIVFVFLINFLAAISYEINVSEFTMYNCIQWVYNIILTVEVVAILIYRKIG